MATVQSTISNDRLDLGASAKTDRPFSTLVVGCGNLLRGDDAAGPIFVRRMWQCGLPAGVRCADGGTGGMDVAFQMRGVPYVILVDAAQTGSLPGTIFEVPGEEVEQLPPLQGINPHSFRWDHALAFARWLLKDEYPDRVTVYLIEGQNFEIGEELSQPVEEALGKLMQRLMSSLGSAKIPDGVVELTEQGYLQIPHQLALRFFPEDTLVALIRNDTLILMPTRGAAAGGLMLKQRNQHGDRSVLLSESFAFNAPQGSFNAFWNSSLSGLEIPLNLNPRISTCKPAIPN